MHAKTCAREPVAHGKSWISVSLPGKWAWKSLDANPVRNAMARDIDRKLRLTAAVLGTVTVKDLAAAFRRVNAATPFDIERAHKWMQGRARPRELQVYEDWAKLLDVGQPGEWIADCEIEAFLDAVCERHHHDREALSRRAESAAGPASQPERDLALTGTYACYSHSWSPYFRGRLIRGVLTITVGSGPHRLHATYAETLPTRRLQLDGPLTAGRRAVHLDVHERASDVQFAFCLFPPTPLVSILAGVMCGTTVLSPDIQISATRIAIVRLPGFSTQLRTLDAYLPAGGSISRDLAGLGLQVEDPETVDRRMAVFLAGDGGGLNQISWGSYQALVEVFDRTWLAQAASALAPA
jgi:hypothetical protein